MKWFSRKLFITLWAIVLLTYIVVTNKSDFALLAEILCAVPLMYLGVNVFNKKINNEFIKDSSLDDEDIK